MSYVNFCWLQTRDKSYINHFPVLLHTCSAGLFDVSRNPIVPTSVKWLAGMRRAAGKVEIILDPEKKNSKGTTWDANEGVGWIKDWSTLVHLFNHKNCTLTSALSSTSKPSFISTQPVTVQQNQDNLNF